MFVQSVYYRDPAVLNAAKEGEISKVEEYLQRGGWIDMPFTKNGNSLLSVAAKYGQREVVQFLIEKGAHQYNNNKNESVLSRAVGEVKCYLEFVYEGSYGTIHALISEQLKKLKTVGEVTTFIKELPKEHRSLIEAYFVERTFIDSEQALQILDSIEREGREIVSGAIVKTACSFADFNLAERAIEKLERDCLFKKELEKDVERARDRLKKIEVNLQVKGFAKSLLEGFNLLNQTLQLRATEIEYLFTNMSRTESFKGAVEFANSILDPSLREFARRGLSYIDGDSMERLCNEEGWEDLDSIDQEMLAAEAFYSKLIKGESSEEKLEEALATLESQKDLPFYHELRLRLCDQMFEHGYYELAFRIAKEEHEKKSFSEGYAEILKAIISDCSKKGLKEWEERFNSLLS